MKKLLILIAVSLINASPSFCQFVEFFGEIDNFTPSKKQMEYAAIEGSPYLNEQLIQGSVKFKKGDSTLRFMRYDIYKDEIEYLENNKLFILLKNQIPTIERIDLEGNEIVYQQFIEKGEKQSGILIKMPTTKCSLYKKYTIEFHEALPAKTGMPISRPVRFGAKQKQWFYACGSDPITLLETDKSSLKKIAGSRYTQLKDYIKDNDLKIKKEEDLIAIFNYCTRHIN